LGGFIMESKKGARPASREEKAGNKKRISALEIS